MGRERREFRRPSFNRDVNKLFIIATEGEKTEKVYFKGLFSRNPHPKTEIFLEVLTRLNSNSSPRSVLKQLDDFKKEYLLREGDELWMVIDRDKQSWEVSEISQVAALIYQKRFHFALSNPAFEIWLLLHVKDLSEYTEDEKRELFENRRVGSRTRLERELIRICGSYNKSNPNLSFFLPYVNTAIERAEALVQNPNERWPNYLGTHVYKLVKKLMSKD